MHFFEHILFLFILPLCFYVLSRSTTSPAIEKVALCKRCHVGPRDANPTGHQNQVLQRCSLFGLVWLGHNCYGCTGRQCYFLALLAVRPGHTIAGTLLRRAAPLIQLASRFDRNCCWCTGGRTVRPSLNCCTHCCVSLTRGVARWSHFGGAPVLAEATHWMLQGRSHLGGVPARVCPQGNATG